MRKKQLLGSFETAALHRLVRYLIKKEHCITSFIKYLGEGGGGGGG